MKGQLGRPSVPSPHLREHCEKLPVRADSNTVKIDQEPLHFSVTPGTECVDTTGHVVGKACCPANAIAVKSYISGLHYAELGCGAYK
ncbi:uncharacterized protein PGTG_14393 [Puccinia graminis f. sp. tritici CRL 75-36-700-3]|uniref:Uncharacterized protein n=1 Tax=Puccinia graminis f. sp. tritici (strain CRL 75-36-700-3 / race SCCL) TaxID=418459 RepID=E3KVG9_PUCGT|nr:uncharacterized protein PGTG_14393 [Puccinia graminis f. sp. tritici CRL 75-36-700-3]EFP88309.2 hypothetical protein PGTG_14393 [Puccinia graminis f. sp. tritici CRL 75-36-700-3]